MLQSNEILQTKKIHKGMNWSIGDGAHHLQSIKASIGKVHIKNVH
jgi:hypothetical protein